ncbi:DoxX-like family protein [Daejeonella rubra]|uniref:DoxX-like family protein n=2 Tax=Daejeonella rubra TaxID=990371 RepID=A0A1G9XKU1_9SPHI|nr:DoxX-like family protein [Daejeonella rubra]
MSKKRKIINWTFVGLMSALFIMSAIMKLMAGADAEIAVNFVKWGLEGKLMLIGMGELIAAILFLIPRTSSLGVLLLSAHLGGAIATHMEHGEMFIPQAVMLLLVWVANYLRNPEMLSSFFQKDTN